jgi:hypothetical protein
MGATSSSEKKLQAGGIMIYLDQPSYRPGDVVLGNVYINMAQSFSTSCLELILKVEQYTSFTEEKFTDFGLRKDSETRYEGYKKLYHSKAILAKFTQSLISPGQYQYPFSFTLPPNLPGSFEYYDEFNTAYVTYILEARLGTLNSTNEIKNSTLIIVNQPLQSLGVSGFRENTAKLKSWCCFPRGTSTLRVSLPKANFYTNDKVIANCEFDNLKTSLDGKNIKVTLIQNIVLKDNYGRIKQLNRHLSNLNYRNIYPHREVSKFILEIPLMDYDNPTLKYLDKCDHINLLKNSDLVSHLQASIYSDFINCTYTLKMITAYDTHFMTSRTPEVLIPLAIYIPDVRVDIEQYIPRDWNPNVFASTNVDFPLPTAEELGIQREVVIQG